MIKSRKKIKEKYQCIQAVGKNIKTDAAFTIN